MISIARFCARFVIIAVPALLSLHGEDLTIPLDGSSILIRNAHFITGAGYDASDQIPILSFVLENNTPSLWDTLVLRFDMGGFCEGEPHQWSHTVNTSLALPEGTPYGKQYEQLVDAFIGKVRKCRTEIIKARLIFAVAYPRPGENQMRRIEGVSSEPLDLEPELRAIQAKRQAEAQAEAAARQKNVEAEKKRAAIEAERQKKLAAEHQKKQAEQNAYDAKIKADEEAKAAEERTRTRATCRLIYSATADKKVSDLTVKEAQQVQACQVLGLYPPR